MSSFLTFAQAAFSARDLGELLIVVLVAAAVWYVFRLIARSLEIPDLWVKLVGVIAAVIAGVYVIRFLMRLL